LTLQGGDIQVTFYACENGNSAWSAATKFNGGIYVARPMCLRLRVSIRTGQATTIRTPIGQGSTCV
jgi:hypothetical protein